RARECAAAVAVVGPLHGPLPPGAPQREVRGCVFGGATLGGRAKHSELRPVAMSPRDFPKYPRALAGYGRGPPDPRWPGGARIAVQFVVNYEEGGERNILHGDATSEAFLSDVLGATPWPGARHMNVESMYEYGS